MAVEEAKPLAKDYDTPCLVFYRAGARLVFALHVTVMASFWFGALYAFYNHAYAPFHLAIVITTVMIHLIWGKCPFTLLERSFLKRGKSPHYYTGGFYQHYLFEKFFGVQKSERYVTNFLIIAKVIPGLSPLLILIWSVF